MCLVPRADSMEKGVEEEPLVPRVAVLCQDGSCSQLPLSWSSWVWGISRDEHALGWTRAREVLGGGVSSTHGACG